MSAREEEIVAAARGWLGTPYRHQASLKGVGCDCLGLLRGVWREVCGDEPPRIPHYRADWRDVRGAVDLMVLAEALLLPAGPEPEAGQIVLFRLHRSLPPKHCGILVAPGRFVHAQERFGVIETTLDRTWRRRMAGVLAFPQSD